MTAKRRTPAEIARDELNDTTNKLKALRKRLIKAEAAVTDLKGQIEEVEALRDWQGQNPLLKNTSASLPPADELAQPIVNPKAYSAQITEGLTKKEED